MTRVHAFADDALGDLDAVGLVARAPGRAGCRSPRWSRRRSPAPSGSSPTLNARRLRRLRPGPRARPRDPRGGLLRRRPDVRQGQRRRRRACPPAGHRRLRRAPGARATATSPGCTSPPAWCRWARPSSREFGFSAVAEHPRLGPGPLAVDTDHYRRRLLGRVGGPGRGRRRPPRPRQRRRRLDPDPGRGQRAGRPQADPRPARPGQDDARDAGADRRRRRGDPDRCATPRRSCARPRRSTATCAAAGRRRHPPGPRAAAGRRGHRGRRAAATPGGRRADPQDRARCSSSSATRSSRSTRRSPTSFADDFLALLVDAGAVRSSRTGRRTLGRTLGPRPSSTTSPSGLARHCRRNLHRLPAARSPGCAAQRHARGRVLTGSTTSC